MNIEYCCIKVFGLPEERLLEFIGLMVEVNFERKPQRPTTT